MYTIYLVRCADGSLYTGITTDLARRMRQHAAGKGAKYTCSHPIIKVCAAWSTQTRSDALKLEYCIKRLKKSQKEALAAGTATIQTLVSVHAEYYFLDIPENII